MKIHSPRFYLRAIGLFGVFSFISFMLFLLAIVDNQTFGASLFAILTGVCVTLLGFSIGGFILSLVSGGE